MKYLEEKAKYLRRDVLKLALEEGGGHLGGSFSQIEIMVSLFGKIMSEEDKFILSKGHASSPLYVLLREKGLNPKISTHPDIDEKNGIVCTTGSLGHGLPIAVGMALARKFKDKTGKIYVLMGDGELQEGTTWEALNIAVFQKLDNLVIIVDNNKLQALEEVSNVVNFKNLKKVFTSMGCKTVEVDGHSFEELIPAFEKKHKNKPLLILANTVKGKGVKCMENVAMWHAKRIEELCSEEIEDIYNQVEKGI